MCQSLASARPGPHFVALAGVGWLGEGQTQRSRGCPYMRLSSAVYAALPRQAVLPRSGTYVCAVPQDARLSLGCPP